MNTPRKPRLLVLVAFFLAATLAACNQRAEPLAPVVIIGLDGATWNVAEPLIEAGELPALSGLMAGGASGPIESCCGTISPAVWTTIVTGRTSEEHGIYDFTMTDAHSGEMVKVNNSHRQKKALWEILTDRGLRMGLLNLFSIYPFDEFAGFAYLIERGEGYPADLLPAAEMVRREEPDPTVTFGLARKLILEPWDAFLVYDRTIDATQHRTWMYYEPERFDRKKWLVDDAGIAAYGDDIPKAYRRTDQELAEFLKTLPAEAAIVVVSDHGGKPNDGETSWYLLATNRLIAEQGLMKLDPGFLPVPGQSPLYALQGNKPALGTLWDRVNVFAVNLPAARAALDLPPDSPPATIQNEIVERLKSLKVGGENLPIFEHVAVEQRQSPQPPPPGRAPEQITVIVAKENAVLDMVRGDPRVLPVGPDGKGKPLAEFVIKSPSSGVHARQGVIILSGPMFKDSVKLTGASVFDVTPTVLAILGLPAAKDMKGRVLTEAFTDAFAAKLPTAAIATYEDGRPRNSVRLEPLREVDRNKLRSLGYL
jgi:predicted AlkP superfamily phosphohydrolase/phosphomutase